MPTPVQAVWLRTEAWTQCGQVVFLYTNVGLLGFGMERRCAGIRCSM